MSSDTDWQRIRNRFHTYGNPISVTKMERIYDLLDLTPGARVLDVGCGKGEVLLRLVERFGVSAVGIDPSPVLELARAAAAERTPDADIAWQAVPFADVDLPAASFDVTVCVGASHAFGDYEATLRGLTELTRPGGLLLVGEGFGAREPSPEYFAGLGIEPFEMDTHVGNVERAVALGLRALYAAVSSHDEWDEFEWLYRYAMERHRHEHGLSDEHEEQLAIRHRFLMAQLLFGRETMGFGLYLFRRPSDG